MPTLGRVLFRRARLADSLAIANLQIRLARESEGIELDPVVCRRGVRAVFRDSSRGEYLVATQTGRIIACLLLLKEWSDWRNGEVLWIHSVYVMPEARGQGVFRRLYERVQGRVGRNRKLRGIRLYVDRRNRGAISTYRRLGMRDDHYQLFEWMAPRDQRKGATAQLRPSSNSNQS